MVNLENKVDFPKCLNANIAGICSSEGKRGKKGKSKCAGVHRGLIAIGDVGIPIQNDNTVVKVPLSNLEVRICASVPLKIDNP